MITTNHLINDIRTIASSAANSDDFKASDELILYWCNQVRSMLISQAIDKKNDISDTWLQTISCLELELVDLSDCCDVELGCLGLRSVKELPKTIETDSSNMIIGVYTLDGTLIDESDISTSRYSKYNKFTSNKRRWFIYNNKLHIINDILLEKVSVTGIWEDPSDLANYISCENQACWTYDSNYPVSMKMAGMITDIVFKTKCLPMMGVPIDNINDSSNVTGQQDQQNKGAE